MLIPLLSSLTTFTELLIFYHELCPSGLVQSVLSPKKVLMSVAYS